MTQVRRWLAVWFLIAVGCAPREAPTAPTGLAAAVGSPASVAPNSRLAPALAIADPNAPADVAFPPRSEPFDFRQRLELKYRDGLRRAATSSFVDLEGGIVWTQEYLRYRVNGCAHSDATMRVLTQIDTGAIPPVCDSLPVLAFPPRNEPADFRQQLEAKYRDGLRRTAVQTFVDTEGDIVWTQEYLRYRVSHCGHLEAVDRVFAQIDGRGVQPVCPPRVIVDGPDSAIVGLAVTFRWHVENPLPGVSYRSVIHLDKGFNPCNGNIEESFDASTESCLTVRLTAPRYAGASLDFAVRVTDEFGGQTCATGRTRLQVNPAVPGAEDPACRVVQARP